MWIRKREKIRLLLTAWIVLFGAVLDAGDNRWTAQGPPGGTIARFTFHPKISNFILAGGNGLFRSKNGGLRWERLDISSGNNVVRIHPQQPDTILAAGYAIFTSRDQGKTWQQISRLPVQEDSFYDLEMDPSNPQILYGVTFRNGVFKSTDGGRSWTAKNSGLQFTPVPNGFDNPQIEIDPSNGKKLYVLTASRKVFRSTNGGESWKTADGGLRFPSWVMALAIDPKNPNVLYAGGVVYRSFFKTTNAGASWVEMDCRCIANAISVDPKNPQIVYTAGPTFSTDLYGVAKTTDGGTTWKHLTVPFGVNFSIATHPANSNLIFAGGFGTGIARSQNAGASWQVTNSSVDDRRVIDLESHHQRPGTIFAVGEPQAFQNRGDRWSSIPALASAWTFDLQIHPRNPNLVVTAGSYPAVSTDGGETWSRKGPFNSSRVVLDPADENQIYLAFGVSGEGIAKSTDQGKSWRFINSGLTDKFVTAIGIVPGNSSTVFVGTASGKIFRSANGGNNWKNSSAGLQDTGLESIAIDPTNSNVIYAITRHFLYKSTNGGKTWLKKGDFWGGFGRSIRIDPGNPRTIFLPGFASLFISTDAGENWSPFDGNGLGVFGMHDLLIDPSQPDRFYLGTDRGIFVYTRKVVVGGPVIEQLLPPAGKAGDAISIVGRNFGALQGNNTISFAGTDAGAASNWSDTQIV